MPDAQQLYREGRLPDAIQALGARLRDRPDDAAARTFLFELLCFAGQYDRAEKHLHVLAQGGGARELGATLYFAALHAERLRQERFAGPLAKLGEPPTDVLTGAINGQPFSAVSDSHPRLGARLELFAAGAYLWIPFAHIDSIEMDPPKRLRDLYWMPAVVRTGPAFKDKELGEVLIPVIYPGSHRHVDPNVALGRMTVWEERDGGAVPYGQKTLLADDKEISFLEVRTLEFHHAAASAVGADATQ